jgi:hypothetical protein
MLEHTPVQVSSSRNLKRLFTLRSLMIAGALFAVLGARYLLDIDLQLAPLLLIVGLLASVNLWTWRRVRRGTLVTDRCSRNRGAAIFRRWGHQPFRLAVSDAVDCRRDGTVGTGDLDHRRYGDAVLQPADALLRAAG